MKILVSGSTGFVGSALVKNFEGRSDEMTRLVRHGGHSGNGPSIGWDPESGETDRSLEGFDVFIHLAGETVAQRWSPEAMNRIRASRVGPTLELSKKLAGLSKPPAVFICASAIGFYGDRGQEILNEESSQGKGFLAEVCRDWEAATEPAQKAMRVVNIRTGMVLGKNGGALARMLPPFRAGLGGPLGSGKQYMSWIELSDLLDAVYFLVGDSTIAGPVNVVARPVTNGEFTSTLGKILGRPTLFAVPEFAPRMVFGEMAHEMLYSSQRVVPGRLNKARFPFKFPGLEEALRNVI